MNVKRFLAFGILGLFFISMMGGVLAPDYSDDAFDAGEEAISFAGGFVSGLLGPLFGEKEMLSRVFFALLLGMIIFSIISVMFKDSGRPIQWTITGAITSLALLGLPANFLEAVRTSYGAMGATILVMIPFIIILVFSLRTRSVLLARVTWVFYAAYYLMMYLYNIVTQKGAWLTTESIPYLAGFAAGVFIFFFVSGIRDLIFKGEIAGIRESGEKSIGEGKLLKELKNQELTQVYGSE